LDRLYCSSKLLSALYRFWYRYYRDTITGTPWNGSSAKGHITVELAPGHTQLTKPLIVIEGFDPYNSFNYFSLINSDGSGGTNIIINEATFLTLNQAIENEGYDLVFVDYLNGTDYIQRNAYMVEEVIRWVNTQKADAGSTEKNVVLGMSMGGLVGRYALRHMELNGEIHDTKLYISHDSPHQGANVPLSVQAFVRHLYGEEISIPIFFSLIDFDIVGIPSLVPDLYTGYDLLQSPAAQQMLIYQLNGTGTSISVATNGFIRLDGNASTNYNTASNYTLSSTSIELDQIIALAVADGNVNASNGSLVTYLIQGTAPNQILTIEYHNLNIPYDSTLGANVQVSFYETSNKIVLKLDTYDITQTGVDMGIHSGVNGFYDKWQEVASGTNNTWIEYTRTTPPPPDSDGDGVSDFKDLDNDNDGITDAMENNCTPVSGYDAYWPLDNSTNDISGNNYNSQTESNVSFSTDSKKGTTSASFNGSSNYLNYSDDTFLNQAITYFSYSFWIKPSTLSGIQTLLDEGGRTNGITIRLNGNILENAIREGGAGSQVSTSSFIFPNDGLWHHIAFTYDNGNVIMYLDGVPSNFLNTGFGQLKAHGSNQNFGRSEGDSFGFNTGNYYSGLMDEIIHYPSVMSQVDITNLFTDFCDNDGDGIPNKFDTDSDGDGCFDANEAYGAVVDTNGDGTFGGVVGAGQVDATGLVLGASYGIPATTSGGKYKFNEGVAVAITTPPSNQNVCENSDVTFSAVSTATILPTTPVTTANTDVIYQWQESTDGVNFSNLAGQNGTVTSGTLVSLTLTAVPVSFNGKTYKVVFTNEANLCDAQATATLTVNPNLPASISIASSANSICSGTSVTFTATPTNGGSTPAYQWKLNGSNVGTNSAIYTNTPANNDAVTCVLNSNASPCATSNPATSNTVTMTVNSIIGNNSIDNINGIHGVICATAGENGNVVMTAPAGTIFINVGFASYGTPSGTCPIFTYGGCHASTSQSVTEGYLLGNNSATIPATNGVFGDPCVGTLKKLNVLSTYTEPICSGTTPGIISGALPTGGSGTYTYLWESSTTGPSSGFTAASGTNNTQNYTPGILTQTTWYRRKVTSGGCSDVSKVVMIKVNPINLCINKWIGTISNNWNTAGNWTLNTVPAVDDNIIFDDNPVNHCQLDQNRSVNNITNAQAIYTVVTNGFKLTVKGDLLFTNGAKINAAATSSTIEFAGAVSQSIPAGSFVNDEVFNLTVNNISNVQLNGNFKLLNTVTATSGKLDCISNSPTFIYAGAVIQSIEIYQFLNESIYNLTVDNAIGVNLNTNFIITNSLLINVDKKFLINPSIELTVNGVGAIVNNAGNGGLVLKSTIAGTASLIHDTNNVPATVERYISGAAEDWHFLSSPVSNQSIDGSTWLPNGSYGNGTGFDLYVWDEPTPCWVYQPSTTAIPSWATVHTSANFVPGRGYLYSVQDIGSAKQNKKFEGLLNNGAINYSITKMAASVPLPDVSGFNLVGNPYPSSIDWKATSGWTRSTLKPSAGGYDMWIWNPAKNNYGVYNSTGTTGTNDVTQYIAPMQGFFVRAATNGNLSFDNAIRVHTGASNWFKPSKTKNKSYEKPQNIKVKIASQSGLGSDEVLLQFGHASSEAGAAKLYSTVKTAPSAYLTMGKEELSVRYLTNTTDNPSVPLAFKPGSNGNYTLSIDLDYADYDFVILEDKKTKTFHNLLETPNYQFKASLNDKTDRFVLHFTPQDAVPEENLSASIYYDGNDIILDLSLVPEQTEVKIYDMLGRIILHKMVEGNTIHHLPISIKGQVYIVLAKSENQSITKKVLVY